MLRAAVPKIEKTLAAGNGPTWEDMRRALIDSRLQGIRDRWSHIISLAIGDSAHGPTFGLTAAPSMSSRAPIGAADEVM
jgi:hypothetical protein